ncbi:MAG: toprim domain-containing protein [Aureibaculum sp.]|nr:toprim domain-containing protein [Aureibaculum sp.]
MKKEKINCKSARNISITEVLGKLEHFPKRESEKEAWFLSPFRSETQASFKVSKILNRWYDHGKGIGGNVIDLVSQIFNCSVQQALEFLNDNLSFFSFHQQPLFIQEENSISIIKAKEIAHPALIQYLHSRKIPLTIARHYCKEVWYESNNKRFFALGLKNHLGGWELRNRYCKNSSSPKAYSYLKSSSNQLLILEGMFDLLSLVKLDDKIPGNSDIIVLNSIAFIKDIEKYLSNYKQINLYFDNDAAGRNATDYLMSTYNHITDNSDIYKNYKDLNEYLNYGNRS